MKIRKKYFVSGALAVLFVVYTLMVRTLDVKSIGPDNSTVGFATLNQWFQETIGVHIIWYYITDGLGIVAILVAIGFGIYGMVQLIKRKSIFKVDLDIILLGFFYIVVMAFYGLFEVCIVNYRPIILNNELEASYPSSHTMIVFCIMITAMLQFHARIENRIVKKIAQIISFVIILVTIIGRIISGVHWFTDIVGGILLGTVLIYFYYSLLQIIDQKNK